MPSLVAWLESPLVGDVPFDFWGPRPDWLPEQPSNLNVLAALIGMNGGSMRVRQYGVMQGGGPWGKTGLDQNEAFALMHFSSFLDGWMAATESAEAQVFGELVGAEMNRVVELYKAAQAGREEAHGQPG